MPCTRYNERRENVRWASPVAPSAGEAFFYAYGGRMRLIADRTRALVSTWMVLLVLSAFIAAPPARADATSRPVARPSPDWLRDAVVYEVFPRAFSPQGNFDGVTAQLDRLRALGVTVIWLMPVHPVGKLKAKGTLGSPYAVRDYDAVNP